MLNTVYTNARTNTSILKNILRAGKSQPTARQIKWLEQAEKDYCITVDMSTMDMAKASETITKISNAIQAGKIKPRAVVAVKDIYYAVMLIDGAVSIKSFIGDKKTAFDKMVAKYSKDNCRYFTEDINIAKASAKALQDSLHRESFLSSLSGLTVKELKALAKEYSIRLGKETRKDAIIIKFEEQLAS